VNLAVVEKNVTRNYKLDLSEQEFYAILTLIGQVSYEEFKHFVNLRYSARLGRDEEENFEIISSQEWSDFYKLLDKSK
jgi:hypothetical protein